MKKILRVGFGATLLASPAAAHHPNVLKVDGVKYYASEVFVRRGNSCILHHEFVYCLRRTTNLPGLPIPGGAGTGFNP